MGKRVRYGIASSNVAGSTCEKRRERRGERGERGVRGEVITCVRAVPGCAGLYLILVKLHRVYVLGLQRVSRAVFGRGKVLFTPETIDIARGEDAAEQSRRFGQPVRRDLRLLTLPRHQWWLQHGGYVWMAHASGVSWRQLAGGRRS